MTERPSDPALELQPGMTLARYRVRQVIGRGGMGVVYLADHVVLETRVALKVIARHLARDEEFQRRFKLESQRAASVRHPHVIRVHDAGEAAGLLYIAMQYVAGTDLRGLIRAGPLAHARAARLVGQVAAALDAAHATGLVHRDVKPGNVLVAAGDHAYLTDFGLAKQAAESGAFTRTGQLVGTLDYISPEQIEARRVDARTDVYSLGCVLFHALTGRVPYPHAGPGKLWAHMEQPVPRPTALAPALPPAYDAVVARAMAKDPAARFASAGDLGRAALAASGDGTARLDERTVARGEAAPTVTSDAGAATHVESPPAQPGPTYVEQRPRPPGPGRTALVVAGIVAGLALAAAAVLLVLSRGGDDARPGDEGGPEVGPAIDVGDRTEAVAAHRDGVWVASARGLVSLDAESGQRSGTPVDIGPEALAVALDAGYVWAAGGDDRSGRVVRIDPASGAMVGGRARVPTPEDLAIGEGAVWVLNGYDNALEQVDSASGRLVGDRIPLGNGTVRAIAAGEGAVWAVDAGSEEVIAVDPASGERTARIAIPGVEDVAVGEGAVWVAGDDGVVHIDPRSLEVSGEPVALPEGGAKAVTVGPGEVWASDGFSQVVRIDPDRRDIVGEPLQVEPFAEDLALDDDALWVAGGTSGTVTRVGR